MEIGALLTESLGLVAITIMVGSYALEERHSCWVLVFSFGCALAALYALLIGSLPFLIAEGIWAGSRSSAGGAPTPGGSASRAERTALPGGGAFPCQKRWASRK